MKKKWILYIIVILALLGVTMRGYAASKSEGADKRAADLAADYRVLSAGVPSGMEAGEILIEARLSIDGLDGQTLASVRDSLPPGAGTAVLSDRFHGTRWLHVTVPSGPDNVYENAFTVLSALDIVSLGDVQLSLNTAWQTADSYSTVEKEDIIQSIFASVGARAIASMSDGRIASASGYSPRLSGSAGVGADRLNITASLCTNPHGGSTFWLGTPVLTVEY